MAYETLKDLGDFIASNAYWFLTAGTLGGLYAYAKISKSRMPVVEGEVIDVRFTNEADSRLMVRTKEQGDLKLTVDTQEFGGGISIRIGCGVDYRGRAHELKAILSPGIRIRARVFEKEGLERQVYEILNTYPNPAKI